MVIGHVTGKWYAFPTMDNVIAVSQGVEGEGGVNSRRETVVDESTGKGKGIADAVSYTHLTLPTIYSV